MAHKLYSYHRIADHFTGAFGRESFGEISMRSIISDDFWVRKFYNSQIFHTTLCIIW